MAMNMCLSLVAAAALAASTLFAATLNTDDVPTVKTAKPQQEQEKAPAMQYVKMTTSMGDIYLELNAEKAPITVENFLQYVDAEFYDNTIFHRVISSFVIQGGGFTPEMQQKPTRKPIKNEWENGLKNLRGTISMARTSVPDSATSQFFISVVDNPSLDIPRGGAAYAVFGKVIVGMDVVDQIRNVPTTDRAGHSDVPQEPVVVLTARKITAEQAKQAVEAANTPESDAADNAESGH